MGTRWGYDKFPKETPLVFYKAGRPIVPPLQMRDGLKAVLENMVPYIQKAFPRKTVKFWRLQSPRHFHGGEWNQNGSCLFNEPLEELQVWTDNCFSATITKFLLLKEIEVRVFFKKDFLGLANGISHSQCIFPCLRGNSGDQESKFEQHRNHVWWWF